MAYFSDLNYLKPQKGPLLINIGAIYQAIYSIFGTKKGSRVFRPTWGGKLDKYLFEPCDEQTARSMLYDILEILEELPMVQLDMTQTFVRPDPINSAFIIVLKLDLPGFTEYEKTLTFVFNQK